MEYPFKDLLPLDEVLERDGYYKDWTHLDPEVFYSLTQISEYIKTKGFGVDVRLLIAQLAEHFGLRVTQITDAMNEFIDLKPKAELSISRSVEALSKSTEALSKSQNALSVANGIDAKATHALSLSESADTLSKSVQEQFNQVVIDGDSSVEAAQARVDASGQTNATLKERLDKEYNEVATKREDIAYDSLVNRKKPKGMISWIDDDSNKGFYDKIYPIAKEFGIPMTIGLITNREMGGPFHTLEQLNEMSANGIEIVSHSHTHDINHSLTDMTVEEMHEEFSTAKEIIKSYGWNDEVFVYPFGRENPTVHDVARQYHKAAIDTFYEPTADSARGSLARTGFNQFRIERVSADYDHDGVKRMMEMAAEEGAWIILMTHVDQHDIWADVELAKERARDLVQYALSLGLEPVTTSEGLRHHGNLAQFDNNSIIIDANGKINSGTHEWTKYTAASNMFEPTLENYPMGLHRSTVRYADLELYDLPSTHAGVIYTHRDVSENNSYQILITQSRNSNILKRHWIDVENDWSSWNSIGLMQKERSNQFSPNAPIGSYPVGELMIQKVTTSDSANYNIHRDLKLGSLAGTIYTYRDAEEIYSHQILVGATQDIIIKRGWNSGSGQWGSWNHVGETSRAETSVIPLNAPLSSYPQSRRHLTKVNSPNSPLIQQTGFGLLTTYRDVEDVYSFQEFMNVRDNKRFTRTWTGTGWSSWSV